MNRILLTSLATLAACSSCGEPPPEPEQPKAGRTTVADSLAGLELDRKRDGVWRVRSPQECERSDEAASGGTEADLALVTTADRGRLGELAREAHPMDDTIEAPGADYEMAEESLDPAFELRDSAATKSVVTRPRVAAPLRAGSTDDNEQFDEFVAWLERTAESGSLEGRYVPMDVHDRRTIRVVDGAGRPIPGARVQVTLEDEDRIAWRGTTLGDGATPYYPALGASNPETMPASVLIEARHGDAVTRTRWNFDGSVCEVVLDESGQASAEVALDVVFVIDTTGSMGDEIARIKQTLADVTARLEGLDREFDLRYGAVLYRDITDAYVTMAHPFTEDLAAFEAALQEIQAAGGGDGPESLNQGLAVAVHDLEWRDDAARLAFLIADAPPHLDYENDVDYARTAQEAVARGIRIHTVAASGLDDAGSMVFRQVAQLTRGKFVFIEYGGDVAASGAAHGVAQSGSSNNLDDILFGCIRDEIAGWGRTTE